MDHISIALKQTYAREGKELRRKAGGYAHAKQICRMRRTVKRQRTILGIVLREVKRKLAMAELKCSASLQHLNTLLERAQQIHKQQPKDKNKLYALHVPEVECIGKYKSLTKPQRRWLRHQQALEPAIGHLKSDHRVDPLPVAGQIERCAPCCAVCGGIQPALAEEGSTPLGAKGYFVALCVTSVDQPLTRKTTIYLRSLLIYACHC